MSPYCRNVLLRLKNRKAQGHCAVYHVRGIAKRPHRNKQSPHAMSITTTPPLVAGGYKTNIGVFDCLILQLKKFWRISNKG